MLTDPHPASPPPGPRLSDETEAGLQILQELLDFVSEFALIGLLVADPFPARLVRERLLAQAQREGWRLRIVRCGPQTTPGDALQELLAPAARDPEAVVWFEALDLVAHGHAWWRAFSALLNERREPLRRGAMRMLLLAMPKPVRATVRQAAADLWSILQEMLPVSAVAAPPPEPAPAPGRTAWARRRLSGARASHPQEAQARAARARARTAHADGHWQEAVAATREEVALLRALVAEHPEAFEAELAAALVTLAHLLAASGAPEPALATEAIERLSALVAQHPGRFELDLARALLRLNGAETPTDLQIAAAERAIELLRAAPEASAEDLADGLFALSRALEGAGRLDAAAAASRGAFRSLSHAS